MEDRRVAADRPRGTRVDSRQPLVCDRAGACQRRIGGFEALDEVARRLRHVPLPGVAVEATQKLVDALVLGKAASSFENGGRRSKIEIVASQLAAGADPRLAAHVDRPQTRIAQQLERL